MASSPQTVFPAPHAPSNSTAPFPTHHNSRAPPVPLRSVLRPKSSNSTITNGRPMAIVTSPLMTPNSSSSSGPSPTSVPPMASPQLDRPSSSPSMRQSYFEKYPRNAKSREKMNGSGQTVTDMSVSASTARAKAARERVKALKSQHQDSDEDDVVPQTKREIYAFPSVDESSLDEREASTSSSSLAQVPRRQRHHSAASSSKARTKGVAHRHPGRTPSQEVIVNTPTAKTPTAKTPTAKAPIAPSRPPRDHLPRSQAHNQLANLPQSQFSAHDLPFIRTSTSSSYTQTTLPDHEFLSTPKSSLYRQDGVLVAAPTSGIGVEAMDALVSQMNGGTDTPDDSDYYSRMFARRSKDKLASSSSGLIGGSKMKHHPLYHPPLPQPPDGISLGRPRSGKTVRREDTTTEEEQSSTVNSAVSSSEREREEKVKLSKKPSLPTLSSSHHNRPSSSRSDATVKHSSSSRPSIASIDDSLAHFGHRRNGSRPSSRDKERDRRNRHRDKEKGRSREHNRPHSRGSSDSITSPVSPTVSTPQTSMEIPQPIPTIDEIIRKHLPTVSNKQTPTPIPSINDIIRAHGPAQQPPRPKRSPNPHPPSSYAGSHGGGPSSTTGTSIPSKTQILEEEEEEVTGRSSIDSIAAEVQSTLRKTLPLRSSSGFTGQGTGSVGRNSVEDPEERVVTVSSPIHPRPPRARPRGLQHAKSFGDRPKSTAVSEPPASSFGPYVSVRNSDVARPASRSASVYSVPAPSLAPSTPISVGAPVSGLMGGGLSGSQDPTKLELAQYLRSPRLTRLLTLRRHPHAGLTVSMADVGSPTGHPVIVYLGLGCVRYLIALYDEMAEALNLRLVCVDRWGLGKTGEPTDVGGRGLLEWASVIEEVADTLGLDTYSVVAHSAGAPYALAGVLKNGDRRVKGSVHLLAPWVSMSVDTGYKWLKYVPNSLIKTAQAAEWKVQGWMLGKPPTITYQAIGYDATAPISSQEAAKDDAEESALSRALSPPPSIAADLRSSLSTSDYDDLADFDGRYGSNSTLGQSYSQDAAKLKKNKKSILSVFNHGPKSVTPPGTSNGSKSSLINRSRSGSTIGNSSVRTISAKSPKLKGLKSLSSLRSEATAQTMQTLSIRHPGGSATPSPEPSPSPSSEQQHTPKALPLAPEKAGLGLPVDDEVMQWGARLKMLEEMSPPSPPPPSRTTTVPGSTRSSMDSNKRKRSISLTSVTGRPNLNLKNAPPVPPLPVPSRTPEPLSPNPSQVSSSVNPVPSPRKAPMSLTNALLRASHAESLKGGTADLLAILERDSKPWGFSYADIRHPVKVWYGDRDDKIAISSVRWMERVMKDCDVKIVKGGGHNLMTNADVVVEVLESVARDWGEDSPIISSFSPSMIGPTPSLLYRRRR